MKTSKTKRKTIKTKKTQKAPKWHGIKPKTCWEPWIALFSCFRSCKVYISIPRHP